ncbi:MAG: pyrimidine dimer DNA glycosylase/endonuclease V [Thermodesulfobacteriota bacterium]|nr:pyrimidine dimer DNA glycosylase/endonuclease V [Thermodesulfobacteriota bacterium]
MNIFVLDKNIRTCARYHADQHVIKMILESAQMLCTVVNRNGGQSPYKSTHMNHPCTLWAGASLANWRWLHRLALALNDEYHYRFNAAADHRSAVVVRNLSLPDIPDIGLTPFAQAMPEHYRVPGDAVSAYRRFYIGEKSRFVRWTRRRQPRWFAVPETATETLKQA